MRKANILLFIAVLHSFFVIYLKTFHFVQLSLVIFSSLHSNFSQFSILFIIYNFFFDVMLLDEFHSTNHMNRFRNTNIGQFISIMRPIIIFGNIFGLMPLKNFAARDSIMVKYTWRCWNFFYSIFMQICIFAFVFTSFYKQFVYRVEFDKISK